MKIVFVCWGNICRSVAMEYLFSYYLNKENIKNIDTDSFGVSNEEYMNPIYPPMKREFEKYHIPIYPHYAKKIEEKDVINASLVFALDSNVYHILKRRFPSFNNIYLLNDYLNEKEEVEDPWYTDRFNHVFLLLQKYAIKLIDILKENNN
ncbi:MAG: hypothetical protein ACI31G_03290 [Bacilli bacterium]